MKKIIEDLLALQTLELDSPKKNQPEALALREQIRPDVLLRFDKFLHRGKKGVALVQNGICKGCQIQIPVGTVNALILGASTSTCGNCGRYLYLAEADAISFRERDKPVAPPALAIKPRQKSIRVIRKKSPPGV